jgi:hypothetical protein
VCVCVCVCVCACGRVCAWDSGRERSRVFVCVSESVGGGWVHDWLRVCGLFHLCVCTSGMAICADCGVLVLQLFAMVAKHSKPSAHHLEARTNEAVVAESALVCQDTGMQLQSVAKKYLPVRGEKVASQGVYIWVVFHLLIGVTRGCSGMSLTRSMIFGCHHNFFCCRC